MIPLASPLLSAPAGASAAASSGAVSDGYFIEMLQTYAAGERWVDAGTLLTQLPAPLDDHPDVERIRVRLALEGRDLPAAAKGLERILRGFPENNEDHFLEAEFFLRRGETGEAQKILDALSQEGETDRLHLLRVRCFLASGNVEGAWDSLLRVRNPSPHFHFLKGLILEMDPRDFSSLAVAAVRRAVSEAGHESAYYHVSLARLYERMQDNARAREELSRAEGLAPINPDLWEEMGTLHLVLGEESAAADAYMRGALTLVVSSQEEALAHAGLSFIAAFIAGDRSRMKELEGLIDVFLYHAPDRTAPDYFLLREAARVLGSNREDFPASAYLFGAALFVVAEKIDNVLGPQVSDPFCDKAFEVGGAVFGEARFRAVMDDWNLRGGDFLKALQMLAPGAEPDRWNPALGGEIEELAEWGIRHGHSADSARLLRHVIDRLGPQMSPKELFWARRLLARTTFFWAFGGVLTPGEIGGYLGPYFQVLADKADGEWLFIKSLAAQFDDQGLPAVGDRLLTLERRPVWMRHLAQRFVRALAMGRDFDPDILAIPEFQTALAEIQN